MKVILKAVSGPAVGRRIEIPAGAIIRIGRTGNSDYSISEDGYMSSVHFAIGCDGQHCLVRDMGSSNGTFVNGSRIEETSISAEDRIMAGGSTFTVQFEYPPTKSDPDLGRTMSTRTFPQAPSPSDERPSSNAAHASELALRWPGYSQPHAILLSALYRGNEAVYALLDPLQDNRLAAFLAASQDQYCSLVEEQPDIDVRTAPLLVLLPPTSRLVDVFIKDGWGKGWGIYLSSTAHPEQVRAHLRDYLIVRTQSGRNLLFRFYAPRLLQSFLERCSPRECTEFFGPISRFIAETDQPDTAYEFTDTGRGASKHELRLQDSSAVPA
jgi:pSer/pThr/pTyr-binding forkhead associated (FHA) protein